MNYRKICVLGLGYIGLPYACTFAMHGLEVIGVDTNPQVVAALNEGNLPIYEPGLRALVQAALHSGNLTVTSQPQEADAFIIAVPTPLTADKRADLSCVISASEAIRPYLRPGNLVMLESTSPPGTTTHMVAPILEKSGLQAGVDFLLAYTPERVIPGQILQELTENARVIGGVNAASSEAGRDLYALFVEGEFVITDATTAEMVKLMENTYRDINIAISNEFSRLAERVGVDIWKAISIANLHPRVRILNPGPGVGGHCIGVVPWFLVEAAPDMAVLIRTARLVNDGQPEYVLEWIRRAAGSLEGRLIAALGLSYKEDVDNLRESPAIEVCRLLAKAGANVVAYEPYHPDYQNEGFKTVETLAEALHEAEILLLLAAHTPFRNLEPFVVAQLTPARMIIDCRNTLKPEEWQEFGFKVFRLGVGKAG